MYIHVLVRFEQWHKISVLVVLMRTGVMMVMTAALIYARVLAYTNPGNNNTTQKEVEMFELVKISQVWPISICTITLLQIFLQSSL